LVIAPHLGHWGKKKKRIQCLESLEFSRWFPEPTDPSSPIWSSQEASTRNLPDPKLGYIPHGPLTSSEGKPISVVIDFHLSQKRSVSQLRAQSLLSEIVPWQYLHLQAQIRNFFELRAEKQEPHPRNPQMPSQQQVPYSARSWGCDAICCSTEETGQIPT
jgi:hypothetical protein